MTREENIATLNEHLDHWKRLLSEKICDQSEGEKTIDALQNAIKALEQEPCEVSQGLVKDSQGFSQEPCADTVSRKAVIYGLTSIAKTKAKSDAQKSLMGRCMFFVEKLPPVTPQQKTGYISIDDAMSAFDDFMCNDIEPEGQEVFLELLKDRAERSGG